MKHWTRWALTCACIWTATLGSCVSMAEHQKAKAANRALKDQLASLEAYQENLERENDRLAKDNQKLQTNVADAAWVKRQREKLNELMARYQPGSSEAIPGVNVVNTSEGTAFQVEGQILFNSGQAEITENGKATLRRLVSTLQSDGRTIRVDGHTDSDPIKRSAWKTNLDLSAARALSVARFLIAEGLAADQIAVAGFGPNRPVVAETDDASKRRNRRVEILLVNNS